LAAWPVQSREHPGLPELVQPGESEWRVRVQSRRAQARALRGLPQQAQAPPVQVSPVQPPVQAEPPQVQGEPPRVRVVQLAWLLAARVELPGQPVVQQRLRAIADRKRSHVAAMRRRWRVHSVRQKVRTRR
jgi:hypothetical protein